MRDAVIVGAVRTPIGKRGGGLAGIHPVDLSAHVLAALVERTGIDPADVEDVIWGCLSQVGEQAWNIGRSAVLAAGWPESVPATTVDRQCGSSQQAVHLAAATVIAGQADLVIAGGVESMSRWRGGIAPNIAYTLALLGEHPRLMATAGEDFSEYGRTAERVPISAILPVR